MEETTPTNELDLGHIAGLRLTASNSALIGSGILWLILVVFMVAVLRFSVVEGVALAIFAVFLHWVGELSHQLGHARAARAAGYPMVGVRFWGVLSSSIYPEDEPELPAKVHISRALGGPKLSLVLSVASGLVLLLLPVGTVFWWVLLFFVADNILVFTLGSLLPLGFTDGTTILHWLRKPS